MHPSSAFERLVSLIEAFLAGDISVLVFCDQFEVEFNMRTKRHDLEPQQNEILQKLFDEVVFFSPFPADRASYPGYRDEAQIRVAAERAYFELHTQGR